MDKNYMETMLAKLYKKTGKSSIDMQTYKEDLPDEQTYNVNLSIGNKNLVAGRLKTQKEGNKELSIIKLPIIDNYFLSLQ
jgi:hypothetical protein